MARNAKKNLADKEKQKIQTKKVEKVKKRRDKKRGRSGGDQCDMLIDDRLVEEEDLGRQPMDIDIDSEEYLVESQLHEEFSWKKPKQDVIETHLGVEEPSLFRKWLNFFFY